MRASFQKEPEQLKRQQQLLTVLKFYTGKIDGLWGPSSIAAMVKFEASPSFIPGIPNHGMPLGDTGPFPAGIIKDLEVKRYSAVLLTHDLLINPVVESVTSQPAKVVEPAKALETKASVTLGLKDIKQ
jgi:hypothetical protein